MKEEYEIWVTIRKNNNIISKYIWDFFFLVQVQSTKIHKLSPTFSFYNGILCSFLLFQVEITQKWLVLSWKISVSLSVAFKKEKKRQICVQFAQCFKVLNFSFLWILAFFFWCQVTSVSDSTCCWLVVIILCSLVFVCFDWLLDR